MAWTAADIPSLTGSTAVVTGASSGLGLACSRALAAAGARVVLAVRDPDKGRAAADTIRRAVPDADVTVRDLDLASLRSVRDCAGSLAAEHERIDLLLANAGIMAAPPRATADGFESQVGTNHLGHFVLAAELMPALERAPSARVVTTTSFAYLQGRPLTPERTRLSDGYDAWQAYADSKLANLQFAIALSRRLAAAGSTVTSLAAHPGLSRTGLQVTTVEQAGAGLAGRFWERLARSIGMLPDDGARSILRAATDRDARPGELYGPRWMFRGAPVRATIRRRAASPDGCDRMWEVSEEATGVRFAINGPERREVERWTGT